MMAGGWTKFESRARGRFGGFVAAIVAGLLIGGPVRAEFAGSVTADLSPDRAFVAADRGWTVEEVNAWFRTESIVGTLAERIAAARPDAFVGSALPDDPFGTPTIYLKGIADSPLRDLVAEAAIPIVIADRQPYSRRELDGMTSEVSSALWRAGLHAGVYADIQSQGRLVVSARADEPGMTTDAIRAALPASYADVRIESGPGSMWRLESALGGLQIGDEFGPFCTSGFTIKKTIAGVVTRGIATAGHCYAVNRIYDHVNEVFHTMTFKSRHEGAWGDFEWYTTPVTEADDFYADIDDRRDVVTWEGTASISFGETVCTFGWGTGTHRCAYVLVNGYSCLGHDRLIMMDRHVTNLGDSGSPWFFDNTAYGIHSGACGNSVWSPVGNIDEALDIWIAVN